MAGENVANYFTTPNTGTDNALTIGGTLTIASGATATANTMTITTLNIGTGGKIKGDAGTGTCSSNAVTISKMAGVITTEALTTAAGASQAITLTNTLVAVGDLVIPYIIGGTNTRAHINVFAVATAGGATITINNIGPTDAVNGTIIIGFLVIKAS